MPDDSVVDRLLTVHGLSMSEIAYLCGMSQRDVRSFASGDPACDDPRRAVLQDALTFLGMLSAQRLVPDPAAWMFTRLFGDYSVTPAVLYRAGNAEELAACVKAGSGLQDLLDTTMPGWRTRTRLEWDAVDGPDGAVRWSAVPR